MSFTRLVAYSIAPVLMLMTPFVDTAFTPLALVGGVVEALVIARFLDRRKLPRP